MAGAFLTTTFLYTACPDATGAGAAFGVALIALVVAGAVGPFLFEDGEGNARERLFAGARRCAWLGMGAVVAGGTVSVLRDGPLVASVAVGAFAGLYALTAGLLGHALDAGWWRCLVAALAVTLLATLVFWDDPFLFGADDRKGSAALGFRLSAAAAASVTLGFDWIHAKALYTGNQTAESLVGVSLRGIGPYAVMLAALSMVGGAVSIARERWARRARA